MLALNGKCFIAVLQEDGLNFCTFAGRINLNAKHFQFSQVWKQSLYIHKYFPDLIVEHEEIENKAILCEIKNNNFF